MITQTDPLQPTVGQPYPSSYVYGNNNPMAFTDPTGSRPASPPCENKVIPKGFHGVPYGPDCKLVHDGFTLVQNSKGAIGELPSRYCNPIKCKVDGVDGLELLGYTFIDHAEWTPNPPVGPTLQVFPTKIARLSAGQPIAAELGWIELLAKYSSKGLNFNLESMRDQYICHQVAVALTAPYKATWNLDSKRPNVGLKAMIAAKCNPS
jgi:Protein of unknown function (DUF2599)